MASLPQNICHPGTDLTIPVKIKNLGAKDTALVGKQISIEVLPHLVGEGCGIPSSCQQALKVTKTVALTSQGISSGVQTVNVVVPLSSSCLESGVLNANALLDVKVQVKLTPGAGIVESNSGNNSLSWTEVGSCTWQMS